MFFLSGHDDAKVSIWCVQSEMISRRVVFNFEALLKHCQCDI